MIKCSKKAKARNRVIAQLDAICRAAIMERDNNTCQRCGSHENLQWSHVHSRRHYSIRWDTDNSKALCMGCHCWWTNHPTEASYWFSRKWADRWERIGELLRTSKPMKDVDLRQLLEEQTAAYPPGKMLKPDAWTDKDLPF